MVGPIDERFFLQMLNTMNFIWAFNFLPAVDVDTKKPIVVDLWAYHKVQPWDTETLRNPIFDTKNDF